MVPACHPPHEEVMSLHTIWPDPGMPGWLPWAGSQAGRADGVVNQEQKPQIPDSVSPELEEQGGVGLDLLQLWSRN